MNLWAIFGSGVALLIAFLADWAKTQQAQGAGVALASARDAAAAGAQTAQVETAIAQAEADAPKTQAAILDRFKAGDA